MIGLLELIEEYPEAIEREVMAIGERLRYLGTERLSWWDLKVIINQASEKSPIVRAVDPDAYLWGLPEQLLAEATDMLHWLQWAKTKDAQEKSPKNMPEPIKRPGVGEPTTGEVYKYDILPADEMLAWLGWDTP